MPHPEQRLEDIRPHRPQSFKRDPRNLAMTANRLVSEYMRVKKKIHVDGHGARLLSPYTRKPGALRPSEGHMNRCPRSGKQCHPTAASAWRVIQLRTSKLALFHYKQRMPLGGFAYRCVHCHQWHITSRQSRHRPADWPRRRLARMEPVIREREART